MKNKIKLLFLLVSILTLISCDTNDDCAAVDPAPYWIELGFVDSQGENLLGTVYQQEEFRIFNSNSEIYVVPVVSGETTRLELLLPDFTSNTEYFIEFAPNDIDTLKIIFETIQGPCFLGYNLQEIIFNGETIVVQYTNVVDLVK